MGLPVRKKIPRRCKIIPRHFPSRRALRACVCLARATAQKLRTARGSTGVKEMSELGGRKIKIKADDVSVTMVTITDEVLDQIKARFDAGDTNRSVMGAFGISKDVAKRYNLSRLSETCFRINNHWLFF